MDKIFDLRNVNLDSVEMQSDVFNETICIYQENDLGYHVNCFAHLVENSEHLICVLPSAQVAMQPIKNPIFHRWSWYKNFPNTSFIALSDPALYKAELHGTWFISNDKVDLIRLLADFICCLTHKLKIDSSKVILYGSSMGGFGGLMIASHIPRAIAVVEVPQLNLGYYPHKNALKKIENAILNEMTFEAFSALFPERTNVLARFIYAKNIPSFRLITNDKDSAYLEHIEFVSKLNTLRGYVGGIGDYQLSIVAESVGHAPLPSSYALKFIETAIREGGNYKENTVNNNELDKHIFDLDKDITYKQALDKALALAADIKYIRDDSETQKYHESKKYLYLAAEKNQQADWPYLKICQMVKLWTNSFNQEILSCAKSAWGRKQTLEAFIYCCRGYLYNLNILEAYNEIQVLSKEAEDLQIANIGNIFRAIISYEQGDYKNYRKLIKCFLENKSHGFDPYIAIPVSTVYTGLPKINHTKLECLDNANVVTENINVNMDTRYIVSVSCDQKYLDKYGEFFLKSFANTCSHEAILHISLLNGKDEDVSQYLKKWGHKNVVVSIQHIRTSENIGPIASLLRFMHIWKFLKNYNLPVVVLDLDTVIKKSLLEVVNEGIEFDVSSRILGFGVAPWEKYTGGFSVFNPTSNGIYIAKGIAYAASQVCNNENKQWWIDQNCFEAGIRMAYETNKNPKIRNVFNVRNEYCVMPVGTEEAKIHVLSTALKSQER